MHRFVKSIIPHSKFIKYFACQHAKTSKQTLNLMLDHTYVVLHYAFWSTLSKWNLKETWTDILGLALKHGAAVSRHVWDVREMDKKRHPAKSKFTRQMNVQISSQHTRWVGQCDVEIHERNAKYYSINFEKYSCSLDSLITASGSSPIGASRANS